MKSTSLTRFAAIAFIAVLCAVFFLIPFFGIAFIENDIYFLSKQPWDNAIFRCVFLIELLGSILLAAYGAYLAVSILYWLDIDF